MEVKFPLSSHLFVIKLQAVIKFLLHLYPLEQINLISQL